MIYAFGDCELDTHLYELRRAGQRLKLEPKVFDVLAYLITHRDRVVPRQELLAHLWPDQFVSDAALGHCIMVVRQAVGDRGRTQHVIKTLHGRGYRFVASLEERLRTAPASPAPALPASGSPVQVVCPQCQRANASGSQFCNACGQALSHSAPANAGDTSPVPLSYTPRHLVTEILTIRSALEGERKQVTVLFCDLVNSMGLAELLGPEGMHTLLNDFFALALSAVHRYGGTINQFLGDGFMALFGAPLAHEDHARRAVLAALELRTVVQAHGADLARWPDGAADQEPLAVQIRMGLNTGLVVVGSIGDTLRTDYTAVGNTTNLAARLQQLAEPGTILLSAATARLARGAVSLAALGLLAIRGRTNPMAVYQVVGRGSPGAALERRGPRVLSRFVGREHELATLHGLLAQVASGQGQVVGLMGEPGMGKSRLLYELQHSLAGRGVTYLEGCCVSYGSTMPYLPVLDILRQCCGITATDTPEAVAAHVRLALQALGLEPEAGWPYLLQLLGVPETHAQLVTLRPEMLKARTFEILRQMLLTRSQQQPLIVAVEDLHCIDKTSEDFFTALVDSLAGAAILLLTTYRPGYRPPWMEKSYMTQIALPRLTSPDSLAVVHSVLQPDTLPNSLARMILEKADGNPLFLEELTWTMVEQGDRRPDTTVPDTIEGVLMARIDRLPDASKRLLQTVAVLGRVFSAGLVRALWEAPDTLEAGLLELQRLEFLYARSWGTETVYSFKHVLTQEVAYASLLTPRRRLLHAAAGQALEALYAERLEDAYDRLAYHYARAEDADKAVLYLSRCADQAAREHAHVEAAMALQEACRHAARLPAEPRHEQLRLELHLRLAHSLYALGRYHDVLEQLLAQQPRVEQLADAALAGRYALLHSQTASNLEDWEQAVRSAQRAIEAATASHDQATMGQAHHVLAMERYWAGQPWQGVEHSQRAIALLQRGEDGYRLGMAHFVLGLNSLSLGNFAPALQATQQARTIGETIGEPRLGAFAAWASGWIYATMGAWPAGIAACQGALEASPDPLNTAFALGWLGYAYLEQGDASEAIPLLEQAVHRMRQFTYRRLEGVYTTLLGQAHLRRGHLETARALVLEGLSLTSAVKYHAGVGWAQRALGQVAQAEGALAEAGRALTDALATFAAMQARFEVARTHLALGELAQRQGHRAAVMLHLTEAQYLFQALLVPRYVERTAQRARALGLFFSRSNVR